MKFGTTLRLTVAFIFFSLQSFAQFCFGPVKSYTTYGSTPPRVFPGEFNSDGKVDLVVAWSAWNPNLTLFFGDGAGNFGSPVSYTIPPMFSYHTAFTCADFNNDGTSDVAIPVASLAVVRIFLGNGAGGLQSPVSFTTPFPVNGLINGDFNGDGTLDLVCSNSGVDQICFLPGTGTGIFLATTTVSTGYFFNYAFGMEINGDSKLDLVTVSPENNIKFLFGTGNGSFVIGGSSPIPGNASEVVDADFNGDGKTDLAASCVNANKLSVLLGQGNGVFAPAVNYSSTTNPRGIIVRDFDLDGKLDIACANYNAQDLGVFPGFGNGSFGIPTMVSATTGLQPLASTDFDGNGRPDIAAISGNKVVVILNGPPKVQISSTDSLLCFGESATITASGASSYTWSTSQNNPVFVITPPYTMSFVVTGSSNSCSNTAVFTQSVVDCTAINQIFDESPFRIFPNPAAGQLQIEFEGEFVYVLRNSLGQNICAVQHAKNLGKLDLLNFSSGVYLLQVEGKGQAFVKKLVVE